MTPEEKDKLKDVMLENYRDIVENFKLIVAIQSKQIEGYKAQIEILKQIKGLDNA